MNKFPELAVIVAGIDEEYQNGMINGMISCAKERNANISCFAAFGGVVSNSRYDEGEYRIYDLINFKKFDGVILLTNTIGDAKTKNQIIKRAAASGLPVADLDGDSNTNFFNVRIDNKKAMSNIVKHVIEMHNAKTINYVSGPLSNPEARDRYDAFLEEMDNHDLFVDERRIYFGEFRAVDGKHAVDELFKSKLYLPDAIICANDAMALAVCEELEARGYTIPGDIIVTGFDNTYNARHHFPALTTVKRPLEEAGYAACRMVLDCIEGREQSKTTDLEASPVFSGSCGCENGIHGSTEKYVRSIYSLVNSWKSDVSLLNRMTTALAETDSVRGELDTMEDFIREIDCEQFCVCLCDNWDDAFVTKEHGSLDDDCRSSYSEVMSAPLIISKDSTSCESTFFSSDMFPVPRKTGGNISYFLPLHFREKSLGYYIITNSDFPLKSMLCHSIMLNLSNSIENIRKLIGLNSMIHELDRLYVKDQLCNIYNRNGFIRAADELFKQCREKGTKLLISFIDMDGLKYINDTFGHKEGDFALQRLAAAANDCCTSGRICARFGGDEFIIVGANAEEKDILSLEMTFRKQLESINSIIGKPYSIDASIGTIVTEITDDVNLFSLITQADSIMYEKKKRKKTSRYLRKI